MADANAVIFNDGKFQGIGNSGEVVPYGKLYFYESSNGNQVDTFTTSTMETKNTYPIVLSASGKADVFLTNGTFDVTLRDKYGVTIWTINNFVAAGGDGGLAPIYTSVNREDITGIVGSSIILEEVPTTSVNIHKNGLLLNEDEYSLDNKTIVFVVPLIVTDEIVSEYGFVTTGTNQSLMYGIGTIEDLLDVDVNSAITVDVKGYLDKNDGGGGIFNYDSTADKSTANGGTVIDPDETLANQGNGVGSGCWIRQDRTEMNLIMFGITDNTISSIPILTGMIDGDSFYFNGYNSIDDGGGGLFVYKSSQSTINNGGTIIDGLVRQFTGAVYAKWFGAKGDYNYQTPPAILSDDTIPIQRMFDSITTGQEVIFNLGSYRITSTINIVTWCKIRFETISNAIVTGNIFLDATNTVAFDIQTETVNILDLGFRTTTGSNNTAMKIYQETGVGALIPIHDVRLTRVWTSNFDIAISNHTGFQGGHILNCTFEGCSTRALSFIGDGTIGTYNCSNNIITNNRFFVNAQDIKIDGNFLSLGASAMQGNLIANNVFDRGDGTVACIEITAGGVSNMIHNNSFPNNATNSIEVTGNRALSIAGNTHNKIGKAAIVLNSCEPFIIDNETINQCNARRDDTFEGQPAHSEAHSGIELDGCVGRVDVTVFTEAAQLKNQYAVDCVNGCDVDLGNMNNQSFITKPYNNSSSDVRAKLSGTFTPILGASTTDGTHTYSQQLGEYTLNGNKLHIDIRISITAKDAALSGTVQLKGLPIIEASGLGLGSQESVLAGYSRSLTFTKQLSYLKTFGQDYIIMREFDSAGFADLGNGAVTATTTLSFTGTYSV